jgi:triacylglycerol lipase
MVLLYVLLAVVVVLVLINQFLPEVMFTFGLAMERRMSGLRAKTFVQPDFTMPYLDGGSGPVLMLIHGFGANKDNFVRMARLLTKHYRVICPDLPGFGDASRAPDASYTMADQVARVHKLLASLHITRLHMGGNSMGGFITAQFAATYPDMIASVWLLDAAGTRAAHESAMFLTYLAGGGTPLLVRHEDDFKTLLAAATHRPPFMPSAVYKVLARHAVRDFALHSKILPQLVGSPVLEDQYTTIAAPALIVWGEEDQILSPAGAVTQQKLFPRNELSIMPGIGHMPMLEAPRKTAANFLAFQARGNYT